MSEPPFMFRLWFDAIAPFRTGGEIDAEFATFISDEYDSLVASYSAIDRHYHNLDHIRSAFGYLDLYYPDASPEMRLAIWYHDVVYDSSSKMNEANSIIQARTSLMDIVPEASLARIISAIGLTKGHDIETADPADYPMLVADLAGLGSSPEEYWRNGENVRREYGQFSDEEWALGRSTFLASFLARPLIFPEEERFDVLEMNARLNMQMELDQLGVALS